MAGRFFGVQGAASGAVVLLAWSGCLGGHGVPAPGIGHLVPDAKAVLCEGRLPGVDLQVATVADLQRALAAGSATSVDLVQSYLDRIAAFDRAGPRLNSIRDLNRHALEEARSLDAERAAGHVRGPLHGIPVLLKDNVGTKDEPTTAGSIALEKNVPSDDATLVQRLKEAGAVLLGKTNLSEFANWVSLTMPNGYSSLGGQVVNAYTGGDPSGSSSGSGVAGSMAFAAAAIGTETSGSILSPSNANSLVGVKPTLGLVSRAGVIPLAADFDTPGPMTRTVHDAAVVLSVIAGPDPKDAATVPSGAHLPPGRDYTATLRPDALKGVRLGYDPAQEGNAIFKRALDDLARLGAVLVPVQHGNDADNVGLPELGLIFNEFKFGLNDYLAHEAGPGLPVRDLTGIILYNENHPDRVKYGQDLLIASDAQPGSGTVADVAALPVVQAARTAADALFAQESVAALVGLDAPWTSVGAEAGYPTVTVPGGYDGHEPHGVSFFGTAWSEAKLLSYAYAYEQGSMRRQAPTVVTPTLLAGVCG